MMPFGGMPAASAPVTADDGPAAGHSATQTPPDAGAANADDAAQAGVPAAVESHARDAVGCEARGDGHGHGNGVAECGRSGASTPSCSGSGMESPSSGGAILAHAGGEAGGDKRGDVSGVAEGGSSGAKGVVYSRDGYANWCPLLPQSLLSELIRHPMAKRMQALPAPLGAAGAGRTTAQPPPEADIVAPPPPPPQASALKICNFACSKIKSITQTEERFAFDDPGLPAGRPADEALKIRLPGGGALLLCVLPGATADAVVRRAAAAWGLASSQLALFCGGRRLGGPAPLSRAGGVRGGGTLRVVQRLAGGAPELTREADGQEAAARSRARRRRPSSTDSRPAMTAPCRARRLSRRGQSQPG